MGSRPLLFGCNFGRTFDSTFGLLFTFVGIGSLIGVMNILATRCAETFNFIAVLGCPLGGDPWPISVYTSIKVLATSIAMDAAESNRSRQTQNPTWNGSTSSIGSENSDENRCVQTECNRVMNQHIPA
jgi:hypothetical protein